MVFVGMSFHSDAHARWRQIIEPAITNAQLQAYRVDARYVGDSILTDILNGIRNARLLLFDITSEGSGYSNGNVMYELGIAHATRLPEEILIIRCDRERLLFDISSIRIHTLDPTSPDLASRHLTEVLIELSRGLEKLAGAVVKRVVGTLDEVCLGFLSAHAHMPFFSLQDTSKAFAPETLAGRSAIRHLLDQAVFELVWKQDVRQYAYRWTPLGIAVLVHLGFYDATQTDKKGENVRQRYHYTDGT